jgi:hypothetical protein
MRIAGAIATTLFAIGLTATAIAQTPPSQPPGLQQGAALRSRPPPLTQTRSIGSVPIRCRRKVSPRGKSAVRS